MNSTTSPYRVIAVCTGNICRSPMAELMLSAAFAEAGLGDLVMVDSAGTTAYEAGRPIDPRAARNSPPTTFCRTGTSHGNGAPNGTPNGT